MTLMNKQLWSSKYGICTCRYLKPVATSYLCSRIANKCYCMCELAVTSKIICEIMLQFSVLTSPSLSLSLSLSPSHPFLDIPPPLGVSTIVITAEVSVVVEAVTTVPSITETEAGRGEDKRTHFLIVHCSTMINFDLTWLCFTVFVLHY